MKIGQVSLFQWTLRTWYKKTVTIWLKYVLLPNPLLKFYWSWALSLSRPLLWFVALLAVLRIRLFWSDPDQFLKNVRIRIHFLKKFGSGSAFQKRSDPDQVWTFTNKQKPTKFEVLYLLLYRRKNLKSALIFVGYGSTFFSRGSRSGLIRIRRNPAFRRRQMMVPRF